MMLCSGLVVLVEVHVPQRLGDPTGRLLDDSVALRSIDFRAEIGEGGADRLGEAGEVATL